MYYIVGGRYWAGHYYIIMVVGVYNKSLDVITCSAVQPLHNLTMVENINFCMQFLINPSIQKINKQTCKC